MSKLESHHNKASYDLVIDAIKAHFQPFGTSQETILVGYSGGLDSTVLLHATCRIMLEKQSVKAIHVNHGLQAQSDDWASHCRKFAVEYGAFVSICSVTAEQLKGQGPEDAARNARLSCFRLHMKKGGRLLLAHHLSDQSETILGNLFRGCGVEGMLGMATIRHFEHGTIERPLLHVEKKHLQGYAKFCDLQWIEDPSNGDRSFDRNRLRNDIMPLVKARWQSVDKSIARTAKNCRELSILGEQIAIADIKDCTFPAYFPVSEAPILDLTKLAYLTKERKINLLRWWINTYSASALPRTRFLQVLQTLCSLSAPDKGDIRWGNWQVHRYQKLLFLSERISHLDRQAVDWDGVSTLPILGTSLALMANPDEQCAPADFRVTFSDNSSTIKLPQRGCSKTIRKLFQEKMITPLIRPLLPRIFLNNELVCIFGVASREDANQCLYQNRWTLQILHGSDWIS